MPTWYQLLQVSWNQWSYSGEHLIAGSHDYCIRPLDLALVTYEMLPSVRILFYCCRPLTLHILPSHGPGVNTGIHITLHISLHREVRYHFFAVPRSW